MNFRKLFNKKAGLTGVLSAVAGLGILLVLSLQTKRTDQVKQKVQEFLGLDALRTDLIRIKEMLIMANEQDVQLGQGIADLKAAVSSLNDRIVAKLQEVEDAVRAEAPQIADDIQEVTGLVEQVNSILAEAPEEPEEPTDPVEEPPVEEEPTEDENPSDGSEDSGDGSFR